MKRLVEVFIMKSILRGLGVLIALLVGFMLVTSCTPGKAQTRTNDGAASHNFDNGKDTAKKGDYSSDDQTYGSNDDFDLETKDADAAPAPVVKSKAAKKTAVKDEDADADAEPVKTVRSAKNKKTADDDSVAVSGVDDAYYQKGIASWYGREFQGKKTASGEKFNMNELTAAHKTLPLGSVILVKNLDNGKIVKVRINDRGPYKGKRILDLSYAAAKRLDMLGDGEAMVGLKVIGSATQDYSSNDSAGSDEEVAGMTDTGKSSSKAKKHLSEGTSSDGFVLQTGAFLSKRNAEKLSTHIGELLPNNEVTVFSDGDLYKVRISGISSKKEAETCKKILGKEEIPAFTVKQE